MGYDLRLLSEAERGIEDQILWYEADETRGGAELADRWLNLLEAALDALRLQPERYGYAPENGRWSKSTLVSWWDGIALDAGFNLRDGYKKPAALVGTPV